MRHAQLHAAAYMGCLEGSTISPFYKLIDVSTALRTVKLISDCQRVNSERGRGSQMFYTLGEFGDSRYSEQDNK